MATDEVFISYTQESVEHAARVFDLCTRLRSDGIDSMIDQYEDSPPEGWPLWMENKLRDSKFVLNICTETYLRRVNGQEEPGKGLGATWEGSIVRQYLYDAGARNTRFIPVLVDPAHAQFVPVPLKASTYYSVHDEQGYAALRNRLLGVPRAAKPPLGQRPVAPKAVKTNPAMFLTVPIDMDQWNKAKWRGVFTGLWAPGGPPFIGLAFSNEQAARAIFAGWHTRYGRNDDHEELRISIIEGDIKGEEPGYSVQVGVDHEVVINRYRRAGYPVDHGTQHLFVSRIHRMNPPPNSRTLDFFKQAYQQHKTYLLMPGVMAANGTDVTSIPELAIRKSRIFFRHVSEIGDNDPDTVVVREKRPPDQDWGQNP